MACYTALTQRRYKWRLGQVLKKLAQHFGIERRRANSVMQVAKKPVDFVKDEKKT